MFSECFFLLFFRCLSKIVYLLLGDIRLNINYLYIGCSVILKVKQNIQIVQIKKYGMCIKDRKGFNCGDKFSVYNFVWKGYIMVRNVYYGLLYWYGL